MLLMLARVICHSCCPDICIFHIPRRSLVCCSSSFPARFTLVIACWLNELGHVI